MKLRKTSLALLPLLLVALASPGVLRADTLSASLVNDTLTATAGGTVTFQVNLANPSITDTFLVSDSFLTSSSLITVDDSPYYLATFPGDLAAGGSAGPVDLFNIIVDPTAGPGIYTGTFSILGGGNSSSTTDLYDLSFNVDVISSTTVPEPGTLSMLFLGLTLAGAFSLLKLRSA